MDNESGLKCEGELEGQPIIRDIEGLNDSLGYDADAIQEDGAAAENDRKEMTEVAVEEDNTMGEGQVSAEKGKNNAQAQAVVWT